MYGFIGEARLKTFSHYLSIAIVLASVDLAHQVSVATPVYVHAAAATLMPGQDGDGGPAGRGRLDDPAALFLDSAGALYIGEGRGAGVRAVTGLEAPTQAPQAYPPPRYFHLPVAIAGTPHFYGGEGGGCNASNANCTRTDTSGHYRCGPAIYCQGYQYGVAANVPVVSALPPYGFYDVSIYDSINPARESNRMARDAGIDPNLATPAPLLPIAQPVADNEWLRGEPLAGGCIVEAGVRYRNVTMLAYTMDNGSVTAPGSYLCSAEYHWATRVLRALYLRAVALTTH